MGPRVTACFISLAVDNKAPIIYDDLKQVGRKNNKILDAIMNAKSSWDKSPLIWVDNYPYKIRLIERSSSYAILLQMNVRIDYKKNGKEVYQVIDKRTVKITFE